MPRTATVKKDDVNVTTAPTPSNGNGNGHGRGRHQAGTSNPPTPIDTAKGKALVARWKLTVNKLSDLLAVDSASDLSKTQREKIEALYGEAVDLGIQLPHPSTFITGDSTRVSQDPAFEGKAFSVAPTTVAPTTPSNGRRGPRKAQEVPEQATRKTAAAKTRAPRKAKTADTHPCLCGCGEQVAGRFKQGHDARYKGLILQVEREELVDSKLPAYMRSHGGVKDGEPGHPLEWKKLAGGDRRVVNPAAKIKR